MNANAERRRGNVPIIPEVLNLAHEIAHELASQGAKAVLLTGSHVRGEAYPESDIDILVIGNGPEGKPYLLRLWRGSLVSVSWRTVDNIYESFTIPPEVGEIIPAMRGALALYDPDGLAAHLKRDAEAWRWDAISGRCDAWVADEITGYAEEVHRLLGNLKIGRVWVAAVQRFVLSCRMGAIMAVHHRILYETENRLWDLVAEAMGDHWTMVQGAAFGTGDEGFAMTCRAALELYALAASEVKHLLDGSQYDIVAHTCVIAGHPL